MVLRTRDRRKLPKRLDHLKNALIKYCLVESIKSIEKYKEEKWTEFIDRIMKEASFIFLKEKEVFKLLRRVPGPQELQMVFFSTIKNLDELKEIVPDWEILKKRKRKSKTHKDSEKKNPPNWKDSILCFKWNKKGHYSYECGKKKL